MVEISINVNIADRVYPLTINIEEEEKIRKAVKQINQKIKEFKEAYKVQDSQDCLAMCSLELMVDQLRNESKIMLEDNGFSEKVLEINQKLTDFFEKH